MTTALGAAVLPFEADFALAGRVTFGASALALPAGFAVTMDLTTALGAAVLPFEGDFALADRVAFGASARALPAGFAATMDLTAALGAAVLSCEGDFALAAGFAGIDGVESRRVRATGCLPVGLRAAGGAASGSLPVSISIPNTSPRVAVSRTLPDAGATPAADNLAPVLSTRSAASTPRSMKSNSGCWSSRAPAPYNTAATCLHIDAQSGQLQPNRISFGDGKSPVPGLQIRSITAPDSLPCSSSTMESIEDAQSATNVRQC
ncbi:hypothetical protein WJ64_31410 [Burkholderia ubonensis]|nr:hypothetical protein WJ64_31410 [Burkholderia ubonensis]